MSVRLPDLWVRPALPVALLAVLVLALAGLQYRWLGQLETAARERLARDLRVATLTATTAVELEVSRLAAALAAVGADSAALAGALQQWEESRPDLAGLVGAVRPGGPDGERWHRRSGSGPLLGAPPDAPSQGVLIRLDSAFVTDSLFPRLVRQIAVTTELSLTAALFRESVSGQPTLMAQTGPLPAEPPDVASSLLGARGETRALFVGADERASPAEGVEWVSWTAAPRNGGDGAAPPGLALQVWHAAGSLERAVAATRRRNLAVAFGVLALMSAVGAATLWGFRRNQRLAEDRATVLAGISHEIRTPLAVIRAAADNLQAGVVGRDFRVAEYGALIDAQAERLAGTVASAVAFARAAEPRARGVERLDLAQVAASARLEASSPRVRLEAAAPVWCRGDAAALAMVARNLIANALEYSPESSEVLVEVRKAGRAVTLAVADRGPGVPPADRGRIFEPFVRGAVGVSARAGGLGLGLALAQRVAALHGGTLTWAPRPDGGSVFTMRLPGVA